MQRVILCYTHKDAEKGAECARWEGECAGEMWKGWKRDSLSSGAVSKMVVTMSEPFTL